MTMQMGLILSAVGHGALLGWVLLVFASPQAFDAIPEHAIAIDLVTPAEMGVASIKQDLPAKSNASPEATASTPAQAEAASAQPGSAGMPQPRSEPAKPVMFDIAGTVAMLGIRAPGTGFDAPADKAADLTGEQIAAFKTHLKRCWNLPAGVDAASSTRVVLRVSLAPDGALQGEPTLVEARASRDGPAVFKEAMRALQKCQPYRMLPRERYKEWRVLDVGLTPREMSGG